MNKKIIILFFFFTLKSEYAHHQNRELCDPAYGTHMTPLITALMNTEGDVLELGTGDYSTPLIHAICKMQNRYVLSVEADRTWLEKFLDLKRPWHDFIYLAATKSDLSLWDTVGNDRRWGVIFVDHSPGLRRQHEIERLMHKAQVFVVHDTEEEADQYYQFSKIFPRFKYQYQYKRYKTKTTLLSNFIDVKTFFE